MKNPLPVVILTGFLGAGKTTLLRQLLGRQHGLRIALIQNELGQAGIDVDAPASRSMIELTEGCVCCLRNPDLLQAMEELWERGDIDRVILETTGLADPLTLTWTLARPELLEKIRLDSVVTVVDPQNFEAAAGEEWEAQVRCGDLVVLSKLDLASPQEVARASEAIRAVNPKARILEGGDQLPTGILLDAVATPRKVVEPEAGHHRHSDFGVVSVSGDRVYDLDRLEDLLEDLPERVFRVKGIVRTGGGDWASFHVVGKRVQLEPQVATPAHAESRIALFGRSLDGDALRAELERCEVEGAR